MANLILHTDLDCKVYIDTEYHGIAKANTDYVIDLSNGAYWVECISTEDANLSQDFDIIAIDPSVSIHKDITMLYSLRLKQLKAKYDSIGDFICGYAKVENKGKLVGYIDTTYQFKYDDVAVLYDGILSVKRDNHYGVINNSKEIIPIKYDSISLLGDKMLRLGLNGRFCLANIEGVKLTPLKYHKIEYAMNGIYAIYFDNWVFVDSNIVEVDSPNNVILYSTNNDTPIKGYDITYNPVFGQVPVAHNYQNGNGLLVFENNVYFLGDEAFSDCYNLSSITIPNSVTSIGEEAFSFCRNLTSITIPDSVISIGDAAFCSCSNLENITIPDSVIAIGESAFSFCDSLTAFYGKFASKDNRCLIIDGMLNSFAPKGLTEYSIPASVTLIGKNVFGFCVNLTSITIPNRVTSIGEAAFYNCTSLTEVIIPNSVISIGRKAFSDCVDLARVSMSNNITSIGEEAFADCVRLTNISIPYGVTSIRRMTFWGCDSLTEIILPDSITSIEDEAFLDCDSLISITIPNSVTSIGDSAFYNCKSLTYVTIPDGVTSIGSKVFMGCTNIMAFNGKYASLDKHSLIVDGMLKAFAIGCGEMDYIVPDDVIEIDNGVFLGCSSINTLTISDSVAKFNPCILPNKTLKRLYCNFITPPTVEDKCIACKYVDIDSTEIYVPYVAYHKYKKHPYWGKLRDNIYPYDFENGIVKQRDNEIWYITIDGEVIQPNIKDCKANIISNTYSNGKGIIVFDDINLFGQVFSWCKTLKSIIIPNSVTSISSEAFSGCSNLTYVTIPDSVTSIGDWAFSHCESLTSITIPDSVISIGDNPFYNCVNIENFSGKFASDNGKVLIIDGCLKSFAIGADVREYSIPHNVTQIGRSVFYNCNCIISLTIPSNVEDLADSWYEGLISLRNIYIHNDCLHQYFEMRKFPKFAMKWGYNKFGPTIVNDEEINIKYFVPHMQYGNYNYINLKQKNYWDMGDYQIYRYDYGDMTVTPKSNEIAYTSINQLEFGDSCQLEIIYHQWDKATGRGVIAFSKDIKELIGSCASRSKRFFMNIEDIVKIVLPEGISSLGQWCFGCAKKLTSVVIPDSVTSIDKFAFWGCNSLAQITIPKSITSIGQGAFNVCSSLTSITIPDSVTSIGIGAFSEHLEEIHCKSVIPPKIMAQRIKKECTIYVPAESVDVYKSAEGWKEYADQIMAQIE